MGRSLSFETKTVTFNLRADQAERLQELAAQSGMSLSDMARAAFDVFLAQPAIFLGRDNSRAIVRGKSA